jgi:hypothetical protein
VHVVSAHTLVVSTPKHGARSVYARVHSTHGLSRKTAAARFTYLPAPTITSLSVQSGAANGGTTVAVQGQNFSGDVQVLFGAAPAASVSAVSATSLVAVSPRHVPGTVHVRVVAGCCASPPRSTDRFTFVGPAVDSIAPMTGPRAGGTVVTITGSGFTAASTVTFSGHPATAVAFVSATQLNATSPAHRPGTGHVRVSTPQGDSARVDGDRFTYTPS